MQGTGISLNTIKMRGSRNYIDLVNNFLYTKNIPKLILIFKDYRSKTKI